MKKVYLYFLELILLLGISSSKVYALMEIEQNEIYLGLGYSEKIKTTGTASNNLIWTTTNNDIVSVTNTGIVTGKSVGIANISLTDGVTTTTCRIHVINNYIALDEIKLSENSTTLNINQTKKIPVSLVPSNASNNKIYYQSNDSSIASVDSSGNVTGRKDGTTYITITAEDKSAIYKVTVISKVSLKGISIPNSYELKEGETGKLSVVYNPSNATNKAVTWKSSNTSVVTVDSSGNLKAISSGSATITATSSDGAYIATSKITVNAIDKTLKSIALNKKEITIEKGKNETLTVSFNPANAENKDVKWSSSNEKVATVENGRITALKPGTAEIKVVSTEGKYEAVCKVIVPSPPIESISFSSKEIEVFVGSTITLETTSVPEDTMINDPIWTSSDEEIVTVKDGVVTGVKVGSATIKISDKEGKITAETTVNVVDHPSEPLMITIVGYDLNFNPDVKNYTLLIGNESYLDITTNVDDSKVTIGGNRDLKSGSIITITINDKEKVTYVINIKKKQNYTIYFIGIISILLFLNIIRLLLKNKRKNN